MILFSVFWVIDAIVTAIALYFFFIGLADGSVSSYNILLWLFLLIILAAVLVGSFLLKSAGKLLAAKILAGFLAIPSLLVLLFFIILISSDVRWN
jgi:Na+/melibiose symporter-like transporter